MLTLLALALTSSPALGGVDRYRTCCAETGAGACPAEIEVSGPGSRVIDSEVAGIWRLTCEDGAGWFAAAERPLPPMPSSGRVLTPLSEAAASCFSAACDLPTRLCVTSDVHGASVVDCETGEAAAVQAWRDTETPPRTTVPVHGRSLSARRVEPVTPARVAAPSPQTAAPPRGRPVAVDGSETLRPAKPEAPAVAAPPPSEAPPDTASSAPDRAYVVPPRTPGAVSLSDLSARPPRRDVDLSLPPAPPQPCVPPAGMRQPSLDQVDQGDEAMIAGDQATALGHYRVALTLDPCNAFAWSSLGASLLDLRAVEPATEALTTATRIHPRNIRAWTELGRAHEAAGRSGAAIRAYQEALGINPDYAPASAGLLRAGHR